LQVEKERRELDVSNMERLKAGKGRRRNHLPVN